jgi:hypothetical protein
LLILIVPAFAFCGEGLCEETTQLHTLALKIELLAPKPATTEGDISIASSDAIPLRCSIENKGDKPVVWQEWDTFPDPQTVIVVPDGSTRLRSALFPPFIVKTARPFEPGKKIEREFDLLSIYPPIISPTHGVGSLLTPGRYTVHFSVHMTPTEQGQASSGNAVAESASNNGEVESNHVSFRIVPPPDGQVKALLAAFRNASNAEQQRTLTLFGSIGKDIAYKEQVVKKLTWAIKARIDNATKALAVFVLIAVDSASLPIDYLEEQVEDSAGSDFGGAAAFALGSVGSRRSVPALIRSLGKGNGAAIRALGDLGDPRALAPLRALAKKSSPERKLAIEVNIKRIEAASQQQK